MVSSVSSSRTRSKAAENAEIVRAESHPLQKARYFQSTEEPVTNKNPDWQGNANSVQKLTSAMIRQPILGHVVRVIVRGMVGFAIGVTCGASSEYAKSCPAVFRPKEEEVVINPLFHTIFKNLIKQHKSTN